MTTQTITKPTLFVAKNLMHFLCDDIDENIFADRLGTTINHPAYVLGHIAFYNGVCIKFLGGNVTFKEDEEKLYQMGSECIDDASLYPDKAFCLNHFESRCQAAADLINASDPSLLEGSAEHTPFAKQFDTLGEVATFMLIGHPFFHFGQISAWRRIAGMNPASFELA